ncbi:hypothetical protein L1987_44958 [Smallanthus sonchifolius]|uniref:Uncharacterized protein n=1 Tax=Smallanthus sonchifolius TaxID=185202 RepID=A0ACB9GT07_9ASTR|nr:hypothetical protein L1987_44958 [Smallanthus sonchifolius]
MSALFESFIVFRKRKLGFICDDIALILFISRKVVDGDHNDGDEESKRDKLIIGGEVPLEQINSFQASENDSFRYLFVSP